MDVHDLRSVGPLAVIVIGVSSSGKSTLAAAPAGAIGADAPPSDAACEQVITWLKAHG